VLPPAQQEQLRDFLQRCDLAKFACADFSPRECKVAADMARDFIRQTAKTAAPAAPATNGQVVASP
jgi:hypothetical protein